MSHKTNGILKRLREKFGRDIPIVESKGPLRLQPKVCDLEGADPKDPTNCVLVHTAARMFEAIAIVVWKSSAYVMLNVPRGDKRSGGGVTLEGHPGKWHWERFVIRPDALKAIADFDRGIPFEENTPIFFMPPPRHLKRDTKSRQGKAYRKTKAGHARHELAQAKGRLKAAAARSASRAPAGSAYSASPQQSASRAAGAHIRVRGATVQEAEKRVRKAQQVFDKVRQRHGKPHAPKTPVFDLSTRNGARGHYKFITFDGHRDLLKKSA